ncbi:hypothetical protein O53_4070 [Microcystis aeruginosa TAIHU98]|uniref:Uncharacterized protein n=1 Tax=Microcystis aeruginosa TAIHU98 TaxID=1134457 RepID=L7E880_MICAE|nr:hypothetical protein O53_4070 [Microcystis aeruginosa TAIHU98]
MRQSIPSLKPYKSLSPKRFVRTININQFNCNLRKDADFSPISSA